MKRSFALPRLSFLLLPFGAVFSPVFTGCGGSGTPEEKTPPPAAAEPAPAPAPAAATPN